MMMTMMMTRTSPQPTPGSPLGFLVVLATALVFTGSENKDYSYEFMISNTYGAFRNMFDLKD